MVAISERLLPRSLLVFRLSALSALAALPHNFTGDAIQETGEDAGNSVGSNSTGKLVSWDQEEAGLVERTARDKRAAGHILEVDPVLTITANRSGEVFPGEKVNFELTIDFPAIDTNTKVEITVLSLEPSAGDRVAHICSTQLLSLGSQLVIVDPSVDINIKPDLVRNADHSSVVDMAKINLGMINTGNSTSSGDENSIRLSFSAVLRDDSLTTGSPFSVMACVVLNDFDVLIIGSINFTANLNVSPSPMAKGELVLFPSELKKGETGVILVDIFSTHPMEEYTISVVSPYGYDDRFYIGKINLEFGKFFECNDVKYWEFHSYPSGAKSSVYHPYLFNTDDTRTITQAGNKISTVVPITALNTENAIGHQILAVGIQIGDYDVWSTVVNITIQDTVYAPTLVAPPTVTASLLNIKSIIPGTSAVFQLRVVVAAGSSTKLELEGSSSNLDVHPVGARVIDSGYCGHLVAETNFTFSSGTSNLGTCTNSHTEDTTILINIAYFVDASATNGLKTVVVSVSTTSATPPMTFNVNSSDSQLGTPSASAISLGLVDYWYATSEVGFRMTVHLPASVTGSSLNVSAMPDSKVTDFDLKVCRLEVKNVGNGLPCIKENAQTANPVFFKSNTNRTFFDQALTEMSGICPAAISDNPKDNSFEVDVIYQLPYQTSITTTSISTSGSVIIDDKILTVASATIDTSPISLNSLDILSPNLAEKAPYLAQSGLTSTPIDNGDVQYIRYIMKPQHKTRGNYRFRLEPGSGNSICLLKVLRIGHNFPCTDKPEGIWDRYTQVHLVKDGLASEIKFQGLTNWGDSKIFRDEYADDDAIEFAAFIRTSADTPTNSTVRGILYSGSNYVNTTYVEKIIFSSGVTKAKESELLLNPQFRPTGPIYRTVPKIVVLTLTVPPKYNGLANISIINNDFGSEKYFHFCEANITQSGLNLPCLDKSTPFNFSSEFIQTDDEMLNYYESIFMEVDLLHNPFSLGDSESKFDIEISILVPIDKSGSINLEARVGTETTSVSFTIEDVPSDFGDSATEDLGVQENNTIITSEVSWKTWIPFNITIPRLQTLPVQISVMTPYDNQRPILTVEDIRFGKKGRNICCLDKKIFQKFPVIRNTSADITTFMQKNFLYMDIGYVVSSGMAVRKGLEFPEDNQFTVEVLVQVTDHPLTAPGSIFNISMAVRSKLVISSGVRQIKINRDISDTIRFNVDRAFIAMNHTIVDANDYIFEKGDVLSVTSVISHTQYSRAEGYKATVQVLLPSWVGYIYNSSVPGMSINSYETNYTGEHHVEQPLGETGTILLFVFDIGITFVDYISLNFTLTLDPWDKLWYGSANISSAVVAQVHCEPTKFGNFPATANSKVICGPYTQATFTSSPKADCVGNAPIDKCGVTASSAKDNGSLPRNVILNDTSVWSPAVREGLSWKEYLQFDFRSPMRISKVKMILPNSGFNGVKQITIFSSSSGEVWRRIKTASLVSGSLITFQSAFTARFAKIRIDSTETPLDATNPVGIQMVSWKGCFANKSPVLADCLPDKTRISDQPMQYRHMLYDSFNKILYFCDIKPTKKMDMFCMSNIEGTKKFTPLPEIGYILGLSHTTKKVYFKDKNGPNLASKNGKRLQILPIGEAVPDSLVPPVVIPAISKTMAPVSAGPLYTADFSGINYNGNPISKWSACCAP